ncbi:39S ribosomal protein L38, mitochondrial-like [Pocillopora damicornis]|nr:39S ribosomal protein L38, mitochondrial-like [Pocillopora damicornis]
MAANMARRTSQCIFRSSRKMFSFPMRPRNTDQLRMSSINTEAFGAQDIVDQPKKRKQVRRMQSVICKKNRHDPAMERAAREGSLLVPLEAVQKEWKSKNEFSTTTKLARHYGIFKHIFNGEEFTATTRMSVTFGETDHVIHGNFLTPSQATIQPTVSYTCEDDSLWTVIFTNPDGNLIERDTEFLHWMVGNIPGSRINDGDVLCDYLPPVPAHGTGFHRFVFSLLKQTGKLDLRSHVCIDGRDISCRTFSTAKFISDHKNNLTPAGLCFFQATWDESVTQTYMEKLGMTEPVFKPKEFLTPEQIRKIVIREVSEKKYRNM